jgi:DNA-binding LacI/PurR family transcriptional regulator
MGRVTLQTIADALGVSRTTVSNAYNRPDQLAPELRERILAAARDLGYSGPDPAARRLRSGRREAVGVLFGEAPSSALADPAAVVLVQGIARATEAAGVALLLVPDTAVPDAVVDALCLYALPDGHPNVVAALERRLPMVVVDAPRLPDHPYVGSEDRRGARLAAEHLLGLGHTRFAVLCGRGALRERVRGYREALEVAGIDWEGVVECESGHAVPAADPRPTALLAGTDRLALDALQAAGERGLAVPRDLSVVGYGDVPAAAWSRLTTVRQPLLEKGEIAGRMLLGDHPDREVVLPVELAVRGTTAPPLG